MKHLADRILQLSLLEIHQLTQLFNDHFDINDSEMMFGAGFGGGGGAATGNADEAAPVVEKTVFELKLAGFDEKSPRFTILKAVRERVFDKYDGVNNWKLVKKKGHRLIYLSLLGDDLLEMHPVG